MAIEELNPGDIVFYHRKPKNSKDWQWKGPATVVGKEHQSLWVSHAGRCHLVAPEHIRRATNEEVGSAFVLRATKDDLEKLIEYDENDPDMFNGEDEHPLEEGEQQQDDEEGEEDITLEEIEKGEGLLDGDDAPQVLRLSEDNDYGPVPRRLRTKQAPGKGSAPYQANMVRRATTERGRQKQLEKELPWSYIPDDQKEAFRSAEQKQWREHVDHNAVEPMSVEESRRIMKQLPDRVLPSRFAYRDKNWAKRKGNKEIPWKHKARLVIGGHVDPDLHLGLNTSAPTVSRQGILLLLQILASNLQNNWTASAGDITAAFLNGELLSRELYIKQPKSGLGNLHPEQIVKLTKGVFGLVDSPHAWWAKLRGSMLDLRVELGNGRVARFTQCPLDPCIFQLREITNPEDDHDEDLGPPLCYVAVHVDDLLVIGQREVSAKVKEGLSRVFPVEDWEQDAFEYIGSYIEVKENEVTITQGHYAETRLFEIEIKPGQRDEDAATPEQCADNRSWVGALSWMAGQTRPDLQTGVSMAQQLQKAPLVEDLRFSNQLARRAREHCQRGVSLRPIDFQKAVLLVYHDAAWSNAPQDPEDPFYMLTPEEEDLGRIRDGPFATRERKAKRNTSRISSQLGGLYLLTDEEVLHGGSHKASLLDWKSAACARVCRSTFAAETMSCAGAIENAEYIMLFLETLLKGNLQRRGARLRLRLMTDCRSLYDCLHKEGIPRVPADHRLAIDLAAIRQDVGRLKAKLFWVPTTLQYSDILTKPLKAHGWWEAICNEITLPFTEKR